MATIIVFDSTMALTIGNGSTTYRLMISNGSVRFVLGSSCIRGSIFYQFKQFETVV